ncbi:sensor histidine kinase [Actinospica robiniae]|uniref:sensor histidine kinase n=1 Tax=Actinospica robiniae TaxID=304901 RepID=UPI00041B141F|nr:ATP-binding protein [Actinospica robiniae]
MRPRDRVRRRDRVTRLRELQPLDRLSSLRIKLGVLVAASVTVSAGFVAIGVTLGIQARYVVTVAVLLSLAVTQVLAHGMIAPLRAMAAAASSLAHGDYSRRVRATSRDEVGRLAVVFNRMAADLEAADRARRELIANVSHELRTPISALRAVLENVVDGVTEPDGAAVKAALAQTERLGLLVEELLDLSRLEAGAVPLDVSEFEVEPFLAEVVRQAQTAGRAVRYRLDVRPPGLSARADEGRLHQVMANLVDNAAKHSPADGLVQVSAVRTALGALRVEVADEGPGIPEPERARVFERFTRGSTGKSASGGGTGLGLAIARWAVQLHGGTIEVMPSARGALIRLELPAEQPSAQRLSE